MDRVAAYLGLVCSDCDAYVATRANHPEELERLARRAREEFGMGDATPGTAMCDGCLTPNGRQIHYSAICEIRGCAVEHDVNKCAHCADYACGNLEGFFARAEDARSALDEIRLRYS